MSALSATREAWRRAEVKRLAAAREAEEAFLHYNAEQRADARKRGLLQDHYRKSNFLMKAERTTLHAAGLFDGMSESAKDFFERYNFKEKALPPKVEFLSVTAGDQEVREERVKKPEPSRWQRFVGWCKRKWTQIKRFVVSVFTFVVEMVVLIDGKMTFIKETGRAAKLLYQQYLRHKSARGLRAVA